MPVNISPVPVQDLNCFDLIRCFKKLESVVLQCERHVSPNESLVFADKIGNRIVRHLFQMNLLNAPGRRCPTPDDLFLDQ